MADPERTQGPKAHAIALGDGTSIVRDRGESSLLHSKGYYGEVGEGGTLSLDTIETLYLAEVGRVVVGRDGKEGEPLTFRELLQRAEKLNSTIEIPYLVYRDLRQRGYVVRRGQSGIDFSVLPRGGTYPKTPSQYWVKAISERTPFSLGDLEAELDRAGSARMKVLLGVVDEESDLTYYLARSVIPRGHRTKELPKEPIEGWLLEDRVSVFAPEGVEALAGEEMFGSRVGERLELSLLEALYLLNEGRIVLLDGESTKPLTKKAFLTRATGIEGDLELRLSTYSDLRGRGLIPKTGFKYGAHFRAYEGDPAMTHARYLIHAIPPNYTTTWPELSRAIRLAHGVRKSFLFSWTGPKGKVNYLNLNRIRP